MPSVLLPTHCPMIEKNVLTVLTGQYISGGRDSLARKALASPWVIYTALNYPRSTTHRVGLRPT